MDAAKRQKVIIGVLAACALGAGGYFFVARDSGADARQAASKPFTGRKTRVAVDKPVRKARVKKKAPRTTIKTTSRKEREYTKKTATRSRKSRRGKVEKKKQKKLAPYG